MFEFVDVCNVDDDMKQLSRYSCYLFIYTVDQHTIRVGYVTETSIISRILGNLK